MKISKKIVVLGHFGVGKSSLVRQFVENTFTEDYKVTIGVHILKKVVQLDNNDVNLILWDLEGQDDINNIRTSYLLGTHAFIYVYDMTRPSTFENLKQEVDFLKENYSSIPFNIVGNKSDLTTKGLMNEHNKLYKELSLTFTSAKTGENVETLFRSIAKSIT